MIRVQAARASEIASEMAGTLACTHKNVCGKENPPRGAVIGQGFAVILRSFTKEPTRGETRLDPLACS